MPAHPRNSRLRRTLLAALVATSVAAPVSGAARPAAVPAPVPAELAPLRNAAPGTLDARYAATRDEIRAAERMAAGHGDRRRAAALRDMADPTAASSSSTAATAAAPPRSSETWHRPSGSPYSCPAPIPTSTGTGV